MTVLYRHCGLIDISINRDTGVRRAIYVMYSGIFDSGGGGGSLGGGLEPWLRVGLAANWVAN
jgi:hypothetical protein